MPDVFDQLEAPSTGDIFDQLGEPEEPQVMQGLAQPSPSYFTRPSVEMPTGDVLRNIESLIKVAGPRVTLPMGGELQRVREPKTFAEGMFNLLGGVGGSVISPLGAAATGVAPIKAVQPLLETGFGIPGAAGAVAGTRELIEQPPKSVGEAVERGGGVLAQGLMGAPLAVRIFRPAIKLVGGGIVEGKLGQTHNEVIADNNLTTKEIDQRGFVDDQGNFNNRAETAAQVPGIETKIEPGQAHATEVAKAQEEVPAPTPPPEEPAPTQVAPSVPEPALEKPPPAAPTGEAQPTVPAAGKAEGGVSAPPAPAIPEGGISPAKVQEPAKPGKPLKLPERPDLPKGTGLTESEKTAEFNKYIASVDKYNEDLKAWEAAQPPKKAIIFRKDNGTHVAITKDPQGGWRATSFVKAFKDSDKLVPWGHERFTTRFQAVKENVAEQVSKLPEVMAEDEVKARTAKPPPPAETKRAEAVPAVAKVQAEVQKVARMEGQRPAKEVKAELVSRIEQAIEAAPNEADVTEKYATKASGETYVSKPDSRTKITIDIPGDGVFTIWNTKEALQTVLDRAKKISTQSTAPARSAYTKVRPTGNIPADVWVESSEPTHEVSVVKAGAGKTEWESRKGKPIELGGNQYFITSNGDTFTITEPNTGYSIGSGKNIKEAVESATLKLKNWTPEQLQEAKDKQLAKTGKAPEPTAILPPTTAGGMVGMGGAVPSEFEVSPQTPTSIKNAQVDVERAKRGLPAVVQPARRAFGEVWDRAMAMIDRDPTSQDRLIESIRQKPRALNDVEDAMLLHRQIDLQNEYGKATRDLAQAFEDGRMDAVAEEKLRVARLSDDLLDIYNIGKKVGTETARGLNARKMMANEDFTLAKMTLEARLANDGKPLSHGRYKEIQELHDKINATQKAYDDYVASTKERLAKLEIDKVIAEQKAAAAPKFDKRILAQAEKIVQGMEKFAEPASRRLRERLAQLGTTPDPSIIYDAAVVGSARIARLGLDLAKLTDSMVADFGEKIRPFMAQIWAESNKMLDNVTSKAPEAVRRAVKKADLAEIKTNVADNIADKVKKGQKDKITTQVHMLARALVKSGITDREQLIDAVHDVLKDVIPGITRRESMDAISGYGDFKQLSKDYISITLRGMKGEMQQLAKLEDMAKGQPPLKSGMERRTPTEIERRLIKEVNDAKNKFQVPVQDPNTQLKSALDTLKTTLKNRISDYQERIRTGDYAKRPRREIVLDPEASRLKADNERVKKIFQRGVALERLKNAQPIEKAGDWIVKWRRGFILSSIKTLGKLTTAAIQRAAITPAEEAIGGVIGKAVPELAKRAPREGGFNVKAEARAISQGITQGMQDAWKTLKTGQSDLDVLYGKEALLPPAAIDFFGHVHGALKAPVKRAEFARSLEKRTQQAVASGVDLSDPLVQSRLVIDSYKDANRAIFQQDNRVITAYKRALQALEAKDKTTGEVPLGGKIASTTARVLLPIVKIPTNIVAETMQYATGSVTGLGSLARAYARGIEKLPPEQADLIMRRLKKGSLGAAVLALGYFNPEVIGGYYQPGEKRPEGTPKPGTIQLYGVDIPSWALHNPLIETLQIGATVRRVADSKLRKRDTENQGVPAGIAAGIIGLGEEVPFVREMSEVTKALNPHERGAFFGELSKSMLIPQFIQQSAQWMDPLKEPAKRKPQTAWQHVEMGIPILRQNVPVKGAGSRYYVP